MVTDTEMITKHFFKVLTIFAAMIAIGLIGIFIISRLDNGQVQATDVKGETPLQKN